MEHSSLFDVLTHMHKLQPPMASLQLSNLGNSGDRRFLASEESQGLQSMINKSTAAHFPAQCLLWFKNSFA